MYLSIHKPGLSAEHTSWRWVIRPQSQGGPTAASGRADTEAQARAAGASALTALTGGVTPVTPASLPSYAPPSIDMGGVTVHAVKAAPKLTPKRAERTLHEGLTDLYDVLFWTHEGDLVCRKVGYTAQGDARYTAPCTTFAMSITPFNAAVTYPTLKEARAAEAELIAKVCADPDWKRIADEAFSFIGKGSPA